RRRNPPGRRDAAPWPASTRSPASAEEGTDDPRRDRARHDPVPDPRTSSLLGQAQPADRPVRPRSRSGKTDKGNPYLKEALGEAAVAAVKPTPSLMPLSAA